MKRKTAAVLAAALAAFALPVSAAEFSDIPAEDAALNSALERLGDIMEGFEDGTFRPEETLTRAELAKITASVKTAENIREYSDVSPEHWAYEWISATPYFVGFEDGTFRPENAVTNAQMTAVAVRLIGKENEAASRYTSQDEGEAIPVYPDGYMQAAASYDLLDGTEELMVEETVTRRNAAVIIANALDMADL